MMMNRLLRATRDIPNALFESPTIVFARSEIPSLIPSTAKVKPIIDRTNLKTSKVKTLSMPKVGETWYVPESLIASIEK